MIIFKVLKAYTKTFFKKNAMKKKYSQRKLSLKLFKPGIYSFDCIKTWKWLDKCEFLSQSFTSFLKLQWN